MSFLSDLHSYWASNATLNAALPATQVYTGLVPETLTFPYAVIVPISLSPTYTTGSGYWASFGFQISVFDVDPDNVEALADAIGGQFDFQKVSTSTISCERTNGPILMVDQDTPQRVYHALLEYVLNENKTLGNTTGIILQDNFADTNGTALTAHAISPVNVPGSSWLADFGTFTIQGNQATGSSGQNGAYVNVGATDVVVTANITPNSTTGTYLMVRHSGSSGSLADHWQVGVANGTNLIIHEFTGGNVIQRASTAFTYSPGTTYGLTVTTMGANITASIGSVSLSYTMTSGLSNTCVGIRDVDGGDKFGAFTVT